MAAFSYDTQHPFPLDSFPMFLIPDTATNMSYIPEQSIHDIYKTCFSAHHPFYGHQADPTLEILPSVNITADSTSTTKFSTCINNSSSSAVSAQYHQLTNHIEKKKKNNFQISQVKVKNKKPRKETSKSNIDEGCITKRSEEKLNKKKSRRSGENDKKKKKNNSEATESNGGVITGYVHVRARRGQATDSHSLAERVRREKISKRMKQLQALVPGCDKVTGKALMLDEIINYVQSLQNQVEFLTLKVASVNPMLYDYGMNLDAFMVQQERTTSLEATNEADVRQLNRTLATSNIFNTFAAYSLVEEQNHTQATNMFNTFAGYSCIDTSTNLLQLQQAQMSNIVSQSQSQSESGNGQLSWDVDEQTQKIMNHSGLTNNLSFLHQH